MEATQPHLSTHVTGTKLEDNVYLRDTKQMQQPSLTVSDDDIENERLHLSALRHKVDWHIVPIMFLCYLMNLIDKVALNYAAVMGLNQDLRLQANEFSNTATLFFAAYLIAELPTVYILTKVPAGKWLGINVILWGIATACTAAATSYTTLLVARIFLGIFEAPVVPTLTLISSQWYTKSEQGPRFAFWYCGLGLGQVIGGLLSFAFQHVTSQTLQGWKIMFVVLGCITVVLGMATFFVIPDSPSAARFLTDKEKVAIARHVASDTAGAVTSRFNIKQLTDALTDPQLLLLSLMTILPSISSGVVTSYSATLIRNFGYTPKAAALLNIPSGVVSVVSSLVVGYGTRRTSHRWAWFVASCVPGVLGGALMSFLPHSNQAGLLTGIYLVNFIVPTVMITYQFTAANTSGHTKRAFSTTLMAFSFGVGNIIGPQTFRARDAPQYLPAKITVLVTQCMGAVLAVVLFGYYRWCNSRRKHLSSVTSDAVGSSVESHSDLTDRKDATFRYVY